MHTIILCIMIIVMPCYSLLMKKILRILKFFTNSGSEGTELATKVVRHLNNKDKNYYV